MRVIVHLALPLFLAGCGLLPNAEQREADRLAEQQAKAVEEEGRIECRIGNAAQFERFCSVSRAETADGLVLTVRKPDGGFRRLRVTDDGRGVEPADGAEPAQLALTGGMLEVTVAGDTYRLPATVQAGP